MNTGLNRVHSGIGHGVCNGVQQLRRDELELDSGHRLGRPEARAAVLSGNRPGAASANPQLSSASVPPVQGRVELPRVAGSGNGGLLGDNLSGAHSTRTRARFMFEQIPCTQ